MLYVKAGLIIYFIGALVTYLILGIYDAIICKRHIRYYTAPLSELIAYAIAWPLTWLYVVINLFFG